MSLVRRADAHRLIPSANADPTGGDPLASILGDPRKLADLMRLAGVTNDRLLAESELLPGIGVQELVFGVPCSAIVNGAFTHAHPLGSRFNGPDRGAWYAAFELETAQAEVAFHKSLHLAEIGRFEDEVVFDDCRADFSGGFHDLRAAAAFTDCLDPASYVRSQRLSEQLLSAGSLGVVYPGVRYPGGTCLACFRPAVVANVRIGSRCRFCWAGSPTPVIEEVRRP